MTADQLAGRWRPIMSGDVRRTSRAPYVSTGHLPSARQVQATVDEAYRLYRTEASGAAAQTYPALARVPGQLFGICVAGVDGALFRAGDSQHEFTIMSVAKPFVLQDQSWIVAWIVSRRAGRMAAELARSPLAGPVCHRLSGFRRLLWTNILVFSILGEWLPSP